VTLRPVLNLSKEQLDGRDWLLAEARGDDHMTREEIIAFFARRHDAFARHDAAALAATHAEDGVLESPWAGTVSGREAIEEAHRHWFTAFPDFAFHDQELLIDGDRVAQIGTGVGTDIGGFMGLAATGKSFRFPVVCLCTLNESDIVHERRIYDFTGMLVQIGVLKAKPA
jgi:predicted ester cyclase